MEKLGQVGRAAAIVLVILIIIVVLWDVPKIQVASLVAKGVDAKDVFKAENDARATLAQILGGLAVLIGLYFAWRNIATTAKNLELTNQNLELTKQGQVTERFTKAIEQLGAPKIELRLGGIYALERIARDSERDHWPIFEILTAYVRDHAERKEDDSAYIGPVLVHRLNALDILAVLRVIRRREWRYEKKEQALDLHLVDLSGADLHDAHLEGANLRGARLIAADLKGAHLEDAHLRIANLSDAYLKGANLRAAHLTGTIMRNADLDDADLELAELRVARLGGAHLIRAILKGSNLDGADLEGANLTRADLRGAHLIGTILKGANLSSANLLTIA